MREYELRLLENYSEKLAAEYTQIADTANDLHDKNQLVIERVQKEILGSYQEAARAARAKWANARLAYTQKDPDISFNGRKIKPNIAFEDLHPNVQRQLRESVTATLEGNIKIGSAASIKNTLRTLTISSGTKLRGLASALSKFPKITPMLASKTFAKVVLYASGALTALELLTFSGNAGCGADTLNKEYINFDNSECKITDELAQNNLDFLSLPEIERKKNHFWKFKA